MVGPLAVSYNLPVVIIRKISTECASVSNVVRTQVLKILNIFGTTKPEILTSPSREQN